MKIVFATIFIAIAAATAYFVYSAISFDPIAQGKEYKTKIKPGMTVRQITDMISVPKKIYPVVTDEFGGIYLGGHGQYKADAIDSEIKNGKYPGGFAFRYKFGGAYELEVWFDQNGKVTGTQERETTVEKITSNPLLN